MNVCSNCGATILDDVPFCDLCGASLYATRPSKKESISVGGWIGRSLIPFIPLVGPLVYLIMLFIWSGDTKKEKSFRNWATAQLIVMTFLLVITIIVVVLFGAVVSNTIALPLSSLG